MPQVILAAKEQTLFRTVVKHYETKQHKKGTTFGCQFTRPLLIFLL
jgi:hypothetical protein